MYGPIKDSVSEASIDMATILPNKPTLIVSVVKVTQGGVERTQDFILRVEHTMISLNSKRLNIISPSAYCPQSSTFRAKLNDLP